MSESIQVLNLIGALVANLNNILLLSLFITRLRNKPKIEYWLGIIIILSIVPLSYLFITAIIINRPILYFIQIGLMITYLILELLLDYILKIEFRQTQWIVIPYYLLKVK